MMGTLGSRASIVVWLGVLPLAGCANQLAPATASAVIERALDQRSATGMPTLTQGSIDLQTGAIHEGSSDNCRSQPLELADLERYNDAQVIHLDRPEPCKWVVTLSAQALHDVTYDETFRPPSLRRDYNTVSIALSEWEDFEITGIRQSGMHAEVDASFRYRYTETMRQLARANIYPRLSVNCAYDNRNSLIECARQLPMTFVGKAWKLDLDVLR